MDSTSTPPHPHLARRCVALASALLSTFTWITIYSALWRTKIVTHWLHHAILLLGILGAFALPCLGVWLMCQCYDRARNFRGF